MQIFCEFVNFTTYKVAYKIKKKSIFANNFPGILIKSRKIHIINTSKINISFPYIYYVENSLISIYENIDPSFRDFVAFASEKYLIGMNTIPFGFLVLRVFYHTNFAIRRLYLFPFV